MQVAVSSLTLGTLYEAILAFSNQDRFETFWPSVCQNVRWLIPSRRTVIFLNDGEDRFEISGMFENGEFRKPEDVEYVARKDPLGSVLAESSAQWFTKPSERFHTESDPLTTWLFQDRPDLLFALPITVKKQRIGAILLVMGPMDETDRIMLNTLGTIYALHVGMTYTLIQITEERKRMQNQLIMQEKMASLGNLVAGVAHEINTPLGAIRSMHDTSMRAMDKLREGLESEFPGEYKDSRAIQSALKAISQAGGVISEGTERVIAIVDSLRSFTRLDEAELQRIDIHEGLEDTLTLIQHELGDRVKVEKNFGDIPSIVCYPSRLNQLFLNILLNAAQAIEGRGEIIISTFQEKKKVCVAIKDTGVGIPEDHLGKVFDPGFTTKGVKVGTGLGLSLCYQIVQDHKGEISVESEVGKGSTFTVRVPVDYQEDAGYGSD